MSKNSSGSVHAHLQHSALTPRTRSGSGLIVSNSGMMVPAQDANGLDSYLSLTNECVRRPYLSPTTARPAALALCNSRLEVSSYDHCLSCPGVAADWWPVIGCTWYGLNYVVGL